MNLEGSFPKYPVSLAPAHSLVSLAFCKSLSVLTKISINFVLVSQPLSAENIEVALSLLPDHTFHSLKHSCIMPSENQQEKGRYV
jgi:hypothetical protein